MALPISTEEPFTVEMDSRRQPVHLICDCREQFTQCREEVVMRGHAAGQHPGLRDSMFAKQYSEKLGVVVLGVTQHDCPALVSRAMP